MFLTAFVFAWVESFNKDKFYNNGLVYVNLI